MLIIKHSKKQKNIKKKIKPSFRETSVGTRQPPNSPEVHTRNCGGLADSAGVLPAPAERGL